MPAELDRHIVVPKLGQAYASGTMVPLLGLIRGGSKLSSGIVVPPADSQSRPLPYMHSYVTLDEYLGPEFAKSGHLYDTDEIIQLLLKQHSRSELLAQLAFLNHAVSQPDELKSVLADFEQRLPRPYLAAFKSAMNRTESRVFVARQPILRAIREVLLHGMDTPFPTWPQAPVDTAIWLVQAIAGALGQAVKDDQGEELWPTVKGPIAMEVIQNYLFHQDQDTFSRLVRFAELWDRYGTSITRYKLRAAPDDLFAQATGVQRQDFVAFGFSLWVRSNTYGPGPHDPIADLGMDPATVKTCLGLLSADTATLASELATKTSDWQMLPFETSPVLRLDDGRVLVLDETLILERITSALYWIVFDHELVRGGNDGELWSGAYSDMIERYAEDRIRGLVPTSAEGAVFYTEEEVGKAYGTRRCDAILDLGVLGLFEVQKGQISLPTRQEGAVEKFTKDTDRLVIQKAAQLDVTAKAIFENETPLTGLKPRPKLSAQPVVVLGGTYPVNPITTEYIDQQIKKNGLFSDARLRSLAVIDLGEAEMLEGLFERKKANPLVLIDQWKTSGLFRFSLRNYLLERHRTGDPDEFRPSWMRPVSDALFADVTARLKLPKK